MSNTIRVQIKNKCNSDLIAELLQKATLVKRTGIRPAGHKVNDHIGCKGQYNKDQGQATFDIDISLLSLVPNDCHVLIAGKRISAKQYKATH